MGNGCSEKESNLSCLDRPAKKVSLSKSKWRNYAKSKYCYAEPFSADGTLWISVDKLNNHKWYWQVRFFNKYTTGSEDTMWQGKEKALSKLRDLMWEKQREIVMEMYL